MANDDEQSKDEPVDRRAPRPHRAFPGGQVRLPRLNRPADAPPEPVEEDPPLRKNPEDRHPGSDRGFEAYYSTESLFEATPEEPDEDTEGPYFVLGLRRDATWEEVAKAHRTLVSKLHPDRYVDDDKDVRQAAERRVRDVNEAYATIRRERAVQRA